MSGYHNKIYFDIHIHWLHREALFILIHSNIYSKLIVTQFVREYNINSLKRSFHFLYTFAYITAFIAAAMCLYVHEYIIHRQRYTVHGASYTCVLCFIRYFCFLSAYFVYAKSHVVADRWYFIYSFFSLVQ